jgi:MFS family permease
VTALRTVAVLDGDGLAAAREPWNAIVVERPDGEDRWVEEIGCVSRWERRLEVADRGDGTHEVVQTIDYDVDLPFFRWMFSRAIQREARRLPLRAKSPWWAPTQPLDRRAGRAVCALAVFSMVGGYLGTLVTQTVAFAGKEFGDGTSFQGTVLAFGRVDIVIVLGWVWLADRRGRRFVLVAGSTFALVAGALGALAPNLVALIGIEIPSRGTTAAVLITIGVIAAEEVPAAARAWAASILGMITAFGSFLCVCTLPLADIGRRGWRLSYLLLLVFLPVIRAAAGILQESRRFAVASERARAHFRGHGRRLALLSFAAFLGAVFLTPASQLQNTFLSDERGYSGLKIAIFTVVTGTPGGIGVVVGGRLAERGRRVVAAVALGVGTALFTTAYLTTGWQLWSLGIVAGLFLGATVPALAVYGPELFPTSLRGRANGVITGVSRAGSVLGLVAAGFLADALGGLGRALLVLLIGPALLCLLILVAFPETAHQELEALNPEDARP